jgi:hypothetical protein
MLLKECSFLDLIERPGLWRTGLPWMSCPENQAASDNLSNVVLRFAPQIKSVLPELLSAAAGLGLTVPEFLLAILVGGELLASAPAATKAACSMFVRIFDEKTE